MHGILRYYRSELDAAAHPCPKGTLGLIPGATSEQHCSPCPAGYFCELMEGAGEYPQPRATPCPAGHICIPDPVPCPFSKCIPAEATPHPFSLGDRLRRHGAELLKFIK